MKRVFMLSMVIIFSVCGIATFPRQTEAAAAVRIGYVDVGLVFDSYNKTKDKDAALSAKSKQKQGERDKIVEKIKNMKNELELLDDKQKEKKQAQLDEEIRRLQDFDREAKEALRRERDDMVREILKEIDAVIKDYAQKKGFTIVLNNRVLIYAEKQDDITQDIINILNSNYKKQ